MQNLSQYLQELKPTGEDGFEGLVANLLRELTGLTFRLAKSGYQAGRDLQSREPMSNVIAVEVKRYAKTTSFDERELLGEITIASQSIPDLDCWVLVSTHDIGALLADNLQQACSNLGVEFFHLSNSDGKLDALCANAIDMVCHYLKGKVDSNQLLTLEQKLRNFSQTSKFQEEKNKLRQAFLSPFIGLAGWSKQTNLQFQRNLQTKENANVAFGQNLNLLDPSIHLVPRKAAHQAYDNWFDNWHEHQKPLAVLGEEGDGKTWSVTSWLQNKISSNEQFPAIIFVSSSNFIKKPEEIILNTISKNYPKSTVFWEKRLENWLKAESQEPLCVLLLDGVNERYKPSDWRELLDHLNKEAYKNRIAVILTCRQNYWSRHFSDSSPAQVYQLAPFNDEELRVALQNYHLSKQDFADNLLDVLRKPRYFDLARKLRTKLNSIGEVTIERLIYEDWKDRYERKNFLRDIPPDYFQNLIQNLAKDNLLNKKWQEQELIKFLPLRSRPDVILTELHTGNILSNQGGSLSVNKQFLVYGLGLLLVNQLDEANQKEENLEEALASWLEPHIDMNIKAEICEFAFFHALNIEISFSIRLLLLESWIANHNTRSSMVDNFVAYIPLDPQLYIHLSERVWQLEIDNQWIQQLLLNGFLRWQDSSKVMDLLNQSITKWLGFINIHGFAHQRGHDGSKVEQIKQDLATILGNAPQVGSLTYANYPLTLVDDDGLFRLRHFALAIASHLNREGIIQALAVGNLAEAIMQFPDNYDKFRWILSTAPTSVWELVKKEVDQLLLDGTLPSLQAAYRLLSCEGSQPAYKLQQSFSVGLFKRDSFYQNLENDPCSSLSKWQDDKYLGCLEREDILPHIKIDCLGDRMFSLQLQLPDFFRNQIKSIIERIDKNEFHIVLSRTSSDFDLERHESAIYRSCPKLLVDFIKNLIRSMSARKGSALLSFSILLEKYLFVLDQQDKNTIYQAWLSTKPEEKTEDKIIEQAEWLLFEYVLDMLDGDEQILHILNRHPERYDLLRHSRKFSHLENPSVLIQQLGLEQDVKAIQRILWFLTHHLSVSQDENVLHSILPFVNHKDSYIRSLALECLCIFNKIPTTVVRNINQNWCWDARHNVSENVFGSYFLSQHGTDLSITEILVRTHPLFWVYAVYCRHSKADELQLLANYLDAFICTLATNNTYISENIPPLKLTNFPNKNIEQNLVWPYSVDHSDRETVTFFNFHSNWGGVLSKDESESMNLIDNKSMDEWYKTQQEVVEKIYSAQQDNDNAIFLSRYQREGWVELIDKNPLMVEKWLSMVAIYPQLLFKAHSLFDVLCEILLQKGDEKGFQLYNDLKRTQGIPNYIDGLTNANLLYVALFRAPLLEKSVQMWKSEFNSCISDLDLFRLCVSTQGTGANDWLVEWALESSHSSIPLNYLQGVALLGMLNDKRAKDQLMACITEQQGTWRSRVAEIALQRFEKNQFAKDWVTQFLVIPDEIEAWGAFHMFLLCVDSRFWGWHNEIINNHTHHKWFSKRSNFLRSSYELIQKSAKRNENTFFEKTLYGQKILKRQVWPWVAH